MNASSDVADSPAPKRRSGLRWALALFVVAVVTVPTTLYLVTARDLERARGALELQVLASRLGAAAIQSEYGQTAEALQIVSGVFDGITNHGIELGSLPENYAAVLGSRDDVVAQLARGEATVTDRLVELFFLLQLPVDTELDSRFIIPATDSGFGMMPPARVRGPSDSAAETRTATPTGALPGDSIAPGNAAVPDSAGPRRDTTQTSRPQG